MCSSVFLSRCPGSSSFIVVLDQLAANKDRSQPLFHLLWTLYLRPWLKLASPQNLEVDSTQIVSPGFGCGADAKDCKTRERQTDVLPKPILGNSGKRLLLWAEKEVNSLELGFNLSEEASKLAASGRVP